MGGALVALIWAIARAIEQRSKASAARETAEAEVDSASAKAVVELVAQLSDLRKGLEREKAARERLQVQTDALEERLSEALSRAAHLEGQVHVLTQQATMERTERLRAESRAEALAAELRDLRLAIAGGHSTITLPPPRG
jgi:chromosome segregation ATPase